jgi:hypothetical protein
MGHKRLAGARRHPRTWSPRPPADAGVDLPVRGMRGQDVAVRIERSATTVSWIPSDSVPGLLRLPFARGIMHYDPPPPLTLADVEEMRRRGEFRAANRLRAYIDVDDGRIVGAGYTGRPLMGLTPITVGALRIMLPAKANRDIQWQPEVRAGEATFVQTAGGRPGFSFLKPTWRWPFLVTKPFTIWTTVRLTWRVDGTSSQELIGASPFPRHWLYDHDGHLVQKSALTRNQVWARTIFGSHTPWGGEDQVPAVAEAETELERISPIASCVAIDGRRSAPCRPATTCSARTRLRRSSPWSSTARSRCTSTARSSAGSAQAPSSVNGHHSKGVGGRLTCVPPPKPVSPRSRETVSSWT